MTLKEQTDNYLETNFDNILALKCLPNFKWSSIANEISPNTNGEYVRTRFRYMMKNHNPLLKSAAKKHQETFQYLNGLDLKDKGTKEFTFSADKIPTEEEIVKHFNIDLTKWEISQIYHKTSFGGKYAITVNQRLLTGADSVDYKKLFQEFIESRNLSILNRDLSFLKNDKITNKEIENALILSLSDLHLDSKSYEGEVGAESGIELSIKRAKDAVKDIIYRASYGHGLEKIIIIGGNDFFHGNNAKGTTEKGTPLDVDNRWSKSFKQGLELISWIIDLANTFAPVDYYTCYGNHSPEREFYLAVALEGLYRNNKQVKIETGESTRKYFTYGNSAFMLCHDAPKRVKDCPTVFITEQPKLYAEAKYRFLLTGHLHSKQETFFISTSENFGLLWKRLPSLSKIDKWHFDNFFIGNQKSAIGLIINKNHGEIAEYVYNE